MGVSVHKHYTNIRNCDKELVVLILQSEAIKPLQKKRVQGARCKVKPQMHRLKM